MNANYWWGLHKDLGWCCLDRSIPHNSSTAKGPLFFLVCKSHQPLRLRRDHWSTPTITFENLVRNNNKLANRDALLAELDGYKATIHELNIPDILADTIAEYEEEIRAICSKHKSSKARRLSSLRKTRRTSNVYAEPGIDMDDDELFADDLWDDSDDFLGDDSDDELDED